MAATPKYYTYAPSKAPQAAPKGSQITLKAGQTLAYEPGKGYYAKTAPTGSRTLAMVSDPGTSGGGGFVPYTPPPPPKAPPVDPYGPRTPAEIDAAAAAQAQGQLTPQQQAVQRQQAIAERNAQSDYAAIQGFQTAAAGLMQGIGPEIGNAYQAAGRTVGDVGTKVAGQVGQDITQEQAADQAFAQSQGQSGGHTVDPTALAGTIGYLGGAIPAASLAQTGAAEEALAAKNLLLPLNAGREQLDARMATANQEQDDYAKQLIDIAAQYPALKAQALQQLNQYELDKANYRRSLSQDAEQKKVDDANIANAKADRLRQDRAEKASEKAAGLTAKVNAAAKADLSNYRWATLQFKNKQEANKAKASTKKGKTIDVQASKLLGHIVYKDGSEDTSIKVKQTTAKSPQQTATVNRAKATSKARVTGYNYAVTIAGTPVANPKYGKGLLSGKGKYLARDDAKNVFVARDSTGKPNTLIPRTTNDPAKAVHTGVGASNYADAQQKVYAEIDGDGLQARYGYSKQQVMALVNTALARAGWKKGK